MGKIQKIVLKNFKSFKKADVPVSDGYTTIVGPNGSGKSNIVDALCFAIGTASMKNLRADRLTDLVSHKSPDGTAAVEVEFRDGKGETQAVSRTIDKAGQSVFRLNGRRTTKFQIEETLRTMNIHADGHNIVMQGDVTRFIKMTPLQRRTLIDEVSGIAEYEMKKDESMRELAKVEEKTKEAAIILSEKEGYLKVLEKEKIEAEVYIKLRDSMKQYQATLVKKDLELIEKTFTKATEAIAKAKTSIDEHKTKQAKLYERLNEVQKKADELSKKIFEEADKKQVGIRRELEDTKANAAILEERVKQLNENVQNNLRKIEGISKSVSEIGNAVKSKEKEADAISENEDNLLKLLHEKQRELE
ncbi:AAA family ATPase, partial [Candidatus Micrarchaeota archaeon]|nr:AAA family ATPase [Candidatus Micrarchaeota archaeon]